MRNAAALLTLAVFALSSCDGTRSETPVPVSSPVAGASVTLGGRKIDVSVLHTEKERRHAVGRLLPPTESQGVLLAWPRERFMKLEGERTKVSFDVVFLSKDATIVEISPLPGNDDEGLQPKVASAYALLLMPGLPAKLGLKTDRKSVV